MRQDEEHLRLLAIFHYVLGGMTAAMGLLPVIHLVVGVAMVSGQFGQGEDGPPPFFGWLFISIALFAIAFSWGIAAAMFLAAQSLQSRTRWTYCLVIAALCCTNAPLGTVLGIFTIIVLMRPGVRVLFGVDQPEEDDRDSRDLRTPQRRPVRDDRITE